MKVKIKRLLPIFLAKVFAECPDGWLANKVTKPSGFCYKAFEGRDWEAGLE